MIYNARYQVWLKILHKLMIPHGPWVENWYCTSLPRTLIFNQLSEHSQQVVCYKCTACAKHLPKVVVFVCIAVLVFMLTM